AEAGPIRPNASEQAHMNVQARRRRLIGGTTTSSQASHTRAAADKPRQPWHTPGQSDVNALDHWVTHLGWARITVRGRVAHRLVVGVATRRGLPIPDPPRWVGPALCRSQEDSEPVPLPLSRPRTIYGRLHPPHLRAPHARGSADAGVRR